MREATRRDRDRYLNAGLVSVDCRFCHVSVCVKKLGPAHTSVQWSSEATRRCAFFTEVRESGGEPARADAAHEADTGVDLLQRDKLVRLVGLPDTAGAAHEGRDAGALEQAGLRGKGNGAARILTRKTEGDSFGLAARLGAERRHGHLRLADDGGVGSTPAHGRK